MNEEWRGITDFPNYEISNRGSVRRVAHGPHTHPGKLLKPREDLTTGYFQVTLYKDKKRHYRGIHRLVLQNFVGPCPPGHNCNHKDGLKSHNTVGNLEWKTFSGNSTHAVEMGLMCGKSGEQNSMAKLKNGEVWLIKRILKARVVGNSFIAKMFKVSPTTIRDIEKGRRWKKFKEAA